VWLRVYPGSGLDLTARTQMPRYVFGGSDGMRISQRLLGVFAGIWLTFLMFTRGARKGCKVADPGALVDLERCHLCKVPSTVDH
jgi:hypothetical protein